MPIRDDLSLVWIDHDDRRGTGCKIVVDLHFARPVIGREHFDRHIAGAAKESAHHVEGGADEQRRHRAGGRYPGP
jgi:hypothetical protein